MTRLPDCSSSARPVTFPLFGGTADSGDLRPTDPVYSSSIRLHRTNLHSAPPTSRRLRTCSRGTSKSRASESASVLRRATPAPYPGTASVRPGNVPSPPDAGSHTTVPLPEHTFASAGSGCAGSRPAPRRDTRQATSAPHAAHDETTSRFLPPIPRARRLLPVRAFHPGRYL